MKKTLETFYGSVLAGISISLGCIIFLLLDNKILGALFFTVGLFLVLVRKYNLYTGKIANIIGEKPSYLFDLLIMWIGNLVGSTITILMTKFTKLDTLSASAETVVQSKLSQGYLSAFIMAMFCGFIIYFAVENYKQNTSDIGKYVGLVFLIPIFIMCGYEHCVADMYYIGLSGIINGESSLFLLVVTAGNSVGSILVKLLEKAKSKA